MGIVLLADDTGKHEVVVFREAFDRFRHKLREDELLVMEIRGRQRYRSAEAESDNGGGDNSLRLEALNVLDLNEARNRYARGIKLICNGQSSGSKLKELLAPHRQGACPVASSIEQWALRGETGAPAGQLNEDLIRSLSVAAPGERQHRYGNKHGGAAHLPSFAGVRCAGPLAKSVVLSTRPTCHAARRPEQAELFPRVIAEAERSWVAAPPLTRVSPRWVWCCVLRSDIRNPKRNCAARWRCAKKPWVRARLRWASCSTIWPTWCRRRKNMPKRKSCTVACWPFSRRRMAMIRKPRPA
jgi:hypothetical protein